MLDQIKQDDQDDDNKTGNASISRSGSKDAVNQEHGKADEEKSYKRKRKW